MAGKQADVFTIGFFLILVLLLAGLATATPSKSDKDADKEPLKCYQCTSDQDQPNTTFPALRYHPKCESGRDLPHYFLIQCDSTTYVRNMLTIYDSIGIRERNAFVQDSTKYNKFHNCGKITSTKTPVTRRGCTWTSRLLSYEDNVYVGGDKFTVNYCYDRACNRGKALWMGGVVFLVSLGASLARFMY